MPLVKPAWPILRRGDPLSVGLVGAWPFYEGSGNTLNDLSGNGNNGALQAAPWVGGNFGSCLSFAGTGSISVPANASLRPSTLTISALVISTATNGGTYSRIVDQRYNNGFVLSLEGGTGKALLVLQGTILAGTTVIANDNKWHLVTATYDGTNARIYVDGILEGTAAASTPSYSGDSFTIGNNGTTSPGNEGWVGSIASVALYNRALSANEVAQLYFDSFSIYRPERRLYVLPDTVIGQGRLPKPAWPVLQRGDLLTQGLVGAWPFYEGSGVTLNDLSGNGNKGALTNGPSWIGGPSGSAIAFTGSTQYVAFSPTVYNLPKVSICCWVKFSVLNDGVHAIYVPMGLANGYGNGVNDVNLQVGYQGDVSFSLYNGSVQTATSAIGVLTTNKWYLICGTFDGVALAVYVNGAKVASLSASGSTYASYTVPNLFLGSGSGAVSYTSPNSYIDDPKIYNRALSANEVAQLYFDSFAIYRPERRVPWFTVSGTPVGAASFIPHSRRSKLNIIPIQLYR